MCKIIEAGKFSVVNYYRKRKLYRRDQRKDQLDDISTIVEFSTAMYLTQN